MNAVALNPESRVTQSKICPRCSDAYDDNVDFCAKDGTRLIRSGQSADLVGTVIAERYRIESRLGEGGMGQVYLGEHVRMRRKSAIKIMRSALMNEPEALQRFTREAENASQLSHPNIAAIFDFGDTGDGMVYLAMEYVDGGSLDDLLHAEALHPDVAADIIGQAADGLQAAHDKNMLHRDIKPDNIMLSRRHDGTYLVKLVDFGIARTYGVSDQKVTRTGFAVGTPQYMSPEQLAGEGLDPRSDQYALALVAYLALTGKPAFSGESTKESLIQRLTSRPQALRDAREDVEWPETLQDVFNRALSPEPADRYDTVIAFAEELMMAISTMTPSQTAELYRRALDVRTASLVARTPGSAVSLSSGERTSVSREPPATASTTGATATVGDATPPKARWPYVVGGVAAVSVALTLWAVNRDAPVPVPASDSPAAAATVMTDSAATVAVATSSAPKSDSMRLPSAASLAGLPGTAAGRSGKPAAAGAAGKRDSTRRGRNDSARTDAAKRAKAMADSIADVAASRSRYPDAPLRAMIARGIDTRAHQHRFDDLRVVVMPTPLVVWRAEQVNSWKSTYKRGDGSGYDIADPIERWSGWTRAAASRRAGYVMEVSSDRTPWPKTDPERLVDFKRGDVASVELLRDGQAVPLDGGSIVPAVAIPDVQASGNRPVFNAFVAQLPPTAFQPRDDGSQPRFELVVRDTKRGTVVKTTLPGALAMRLYNELAPWRDALAR
jgi:serine/threonine-protein kinase